MLIYIKLFLEFWFCLVYREKNCEEKILGKNNWVMYIKNIKYLMIDCYKKNIDGKMDI